MAELISSRYAGALFEVSLEIKKEEETIEGEIRRLKEKCENSNAKDLCNYLNFIFYDI